MIDFIKYVVKSFGNIIQMILKIILVIILIFGSYEYLNRVFYNKEIDGGQSFHALPEDSMDVIVLGSSHAQYSFVPSFFYFDSGLYSYVLGSGCQPYEASYQMLKEALKTQNPKLVIMEVFTVMPLSSVCDGDGCYIAAASQMTGEERINTISYISEEKAEEYKNEFFNLHNNWKTLEDYSELLPNEVFKEKEISTDFGYVFQINENMLPNGWWFGLSYKDDLDVELQQIDLDSINAIYNLCKENGIQLLLYKTPIDSISQEDQSYLHKVWQWADEKGVEYLDFTQLCKQMDTYLQIHYGSFHAYVTGASEITYYISNYVKQMDINFEHDDIEKLNNLYEIGSRYYALCAAETETDPYKYLKRMKNSDDYIMINYNPHKGIMSEKMYNELLKFGLDPNTFNRYDEYYALIRNGEVISENNECAFSDELGIYVSYESVSYRWKKIFETSNTSLNITIVNPDSGQSVVKEIDTSRDFDYGERYYSKIK